MSAGRCSISSTWCSFLAPPLCCHGRSGATHCAPPRTLACCRKDTTACLPACLHLLLFPRSQQERSIQAFQEREKQVTAAARAQYRQWERQKVERMRDDQEQWKVKQIQLRAMQMYQKRL